MDQLTNIEEKNIGRASCQSCECWTIFFSFYFIFSLFSSFISILFRVRIEYDVTCHMLLSQYGHIMSQSQSQDHVIQKKS